jgi:CheY-like chemotaxis protein
MHILIVDDDPLVGELVAAMLSDLGHECRVAGNAIEALEQLDADERIALVISDLNMPLISGLDLFHELGSRGQAVPFVLLTGYDPGPIWAQTPGLAAVLAKDASLEETLPSLVAELSRAKGNR